MLFSPGYPAALRLEYYPVIFGHRASPKQKGSVHPATACLRRLESATAEPALAKVYALVSDGNSALNLRTGADLLPEFSHTDGVRQRMTGYAYGLKCFNHVRHLLPGWGIAVRIAGSPCSNKLPAPCWISPTVLMDIIDQPQRLAIDWLVFPLLESLDKDKGKAG